MVLLGIRTSVKEDLGCTAAEMVCGSTLRVPAQVFAHTEEVLDPPSYMSRLRMAMQKVRPQQPRHHGQRHSYVNPHLDKCIHVPSNPL